MQSICLFIDLSLDSSVHIEKSRQMIENYIKFFLCVLHVDQFVSLCSFALYIDNFAVDVVIRRHLETIIMIIKA